MVEVIKTYRQTVPAMRFIGRKYGDEDRVGGGFGKQWSDWFSKGWFEALEREQGNLKELYNDNGAYIGLMRHKEGEPFQYWIGMFLPENTKVPDGFSYIDFPKADFGVGYLYGKEANIFCNEPKVYEKLTEEGYKVINDEDGACWFFERYVCPRYTTPDEKGNIILDICFFVEKV